MDELLATVGSRRSRAEEVTRKQFDMTQMLREATEHVSETSRGADDGCFRRALAHEWRVSSAAAHARLWPLNVRPTERTPAGGDLHHRSLESSPEEFTQAIGAAVLMTNGALDLRDTRRRKHH